MNSSIVRFASRMIARSSGSLIVPPEWYGDHGPCDGMGIDEDQMTSFLTILDKSRSLERSDYLPGGQ